MVQAHKRDDSDLDVGLTTGALRAIMAAPGTSVGRADDLARRLSDAIRVGLILDGERLPSETRLAAQLGVAPATLREVLRILRGDGLITTRRGHGGGTVVTAPQDRGATLDTGLASLSMIDIRDLGDQRRAVFAAAAELAADRALEMDVARMRSHIERLADGRDAGELRRADSLYAMEVSAAAQSSRLAREDLRLRAEIGDLLWMQSDADGVARAVALRARLTDAVAARDRVEAGSAARAVIELDTTRLLDHRLAAYRAHEATDDAGGGDPIQVLQAELGRLTDSLALLSDAFSELVATSPRLQRKDLASLRPAIVDVLGKHVGTLSGAGIVLRPGLLLDAERWLEWMWTSSEGRLEPLRINLEPTAPDFYDYVATAWYQHPLESGQSEVTGPYVDAVCTGEYVLTLSVPVLIKGEFVGVVAADVLLGVVERIAIPLLVEAGTPSAVVSREGRVMVSTDGRHTSGSLLTDTTGVRIHVLTTVSVSDHADSV